jgi:hypothetical protein
VLELQRELLAVRRVTESSEPVAKFNEELIQALSTAKQAKESEELAISAALTLQSELFELQNELKKARTESTENRELRKELEEARGEFIKAQVVEAQMAELMEDLQRARSLAVKGEVLEVVVADLREELQKARVEEAKAREDVEAVHRRVGTALTRRNQPGGSIFGGGRLLRFAAWAPLVLLSIATFSQRSSDPVKLLEVSFAPLPQPPLPSWGSGRLRTKCRRWLSGSSSSSSSSGLEGLGSNAR